jgi:hypothetical protein
MKGKVWICCWVLAVTSDLPARARDEPSSPGRTCALVISGLSKDPNERAAKERIVSDLRAYLLDKAAVAPGRLTVLAPAGPSSAWAQPPTSDNVRKAIEFCAEACGPGDRFFLFYTGQANVVAGALRFNLPGPDVAQDDLAAWLNSMKSTRQLVVLDCPCAAAAARALARRGRVLLCAAQEDQPYATRFGAHFVPALARAHHDTNHDGQVSVLEAFTAAARETGQWYEQRQLLPTETPCLEDDGDGVPSARPWRFEQDGTDGRRAAEFFLAATGASDER